MIRFTYFGEQHELLVYAEGERNQLTWIDGWEGDRFRSFLVHEMKEVH